MCFPLPKSCIEDVSMHCRTYVCMDARTHANTQRYIFRIFSKLGFYILQNLLNNFPKWDGLTIGVRIVLLFQLLTVFPLLAYMLRIQLLSSICKTECNRSLVLVVNLILVFICILFATFMPYIGTITRYTGALSGLIYVFTLPSLLHLSILKRQRKLSVCALLIHLSIPIIGVLNLVAQFFITNK